MMINLGLEDFKLITNNAKKAKFYSTEIGNFGSDDIDKLVKFKLKGMNNLPKNGKTTFAYKIDDVKKLQLNLMAVG